MYKNGKLFGKINIIDLIVLLLVLVFIIGMVIRVGGTKTGEITTKAGFEYVVKVENIRDFTVKALEEKGVIIADWGRVVKGILDGEFTVPNANHTYTKNSFIVSDGYHANALTGYITTLTAYCAVMGEKAAGQPYEFYNDTSLNSKFDILKYINTYYTNGTSETNFHEIFESANDMKGIQQVIDENLEAKPYRENPLP